MPWLGHKIAVFADISNRSHDYDLLVDPMLGHAASAYDALIANDTMWLCGVAYAALGGDIRLLRGSGATARRLLLEVDLVAEVLPANEPSHRLFRAAGYVWRNGRYVNSAPIGARAGDSSLRTAPPP